MASLTRSPSDRPDTGSDVVSSPGWLRCNPARPLKALSSDCGHAGGARPARLGACPVRADARRSQRAGSRLGTCRHVGACEVLQSPHVRGLRYGCDGGCVRRSVVAAGAQPHLAHAQADEDRHCDAVRGRGAGLLDWAERLHGVPPCLAAGARKRALALVARSTRVSTTAAAMLMAVVLVAVVLAAMCSRATTLAGWLSRPTRGLAVHRSGMSGPRYMHVRIE
jgi:hypothetical protein